MFLSPFRNGLKSILYLLIQLINRGISHYVAFLTYTYEEYAALPATPSPSELMEHILDSDPLTDMRVMGNRYQYKDLVDELNEKIKNGL